MNGPKHCANSTRPSASFTSQWTGIKLESPDQSMMQFEEYCKFRSSLQMQMLINGRTTKVFGPDDQIFAGLILMEQQWQYACRASSLPSSFSGGMPLGNLFFNENNSNGNSANYSFSQPQSRSRSRRSVGVKRRIKKYEGKPKKPLTSFMLFLKDFRKTLVTSQACQTKTSPHEINKLAGKQWHMLPENIKLQYKNEAANALAKWQEENFMPQAPSVKKEAPYVLEDNVPKDQNGGGSMELVDSKTLVDSSKRLTEASSSSGDSSSSNSSGSDSEGDSSN